jgi:dihydroorotase
MQKYLFKNIRVVNEGKILNSDVLVVNDRIERIDNSIQAKGNAEEIDGSGKFLFPGAIDDQVHFREPGLTHKADIYHEARAAVAGGVTSFMEMPNTIPNALTIDLLEDKYQRASQNSLANYSFYMGTSNNNSEEVFKINKLKEKVCGVKVFMGSSTGNMLVDKPATLEKIFEKCEVLVASHCESERVILSNYEKIKSSKRELTPADHPLVRNDNACYESSLFAVNLARKHDTRLHILHISTEKELQLFRNDIPLKDKRITAEVCVHHLHFTSNDYDRLGYAIKCNPAIKSPENKRALWQGLLDNRLDVIATDHAPHLISEKQPPYESAHSGLPLVQHSLLLMLHYFKQGSISMEKIAEKMSHAVADCFNIRDRGYIREGYFADLVVVDPDRSFKVTPGNTFYKCGWSPLEDFEFPATITHTMVSGNLVYGNGEFNESVKGQRLSFDR